MYMYIYTNMCVYVYIYIYVYRAYVYVYIHIYIYIYDICIHTITQKTCGPKAPRAEATAGSTALKSLQCRCAADALHKRREGISGFAESPTNDYQAATIT